MSAIDSAVNFMINIANDASHGYDQIYRWGERGDYDCSGLVITAYENAGVRVKSSGATYTGNMYNVFRKMGFSDVTGSCNLSNGSGMQRGDVLLNHIHHTAMYIGGGQVAQASINEKGTATGGQPGDQKQLQGLKGEINICAYYNYPWNSVLRYTGQAGSGSYDPMSKGYLVQGDVGSAVGTMQKMLIALGYSCGSSGVDNSFGPDTEAALRRFQSSNGLAVDGSYGPASQAKLKELYNKKNSSSSKIVLDVDSTWGYNTTRRSQQYFGTIMDGIVSSQPSCNKPYLCGVNSTGWEFVSNGATGSDVVIAIQRMVGVYQDRFFGPNTALALQKFLKNKGYYGGKLDRSFGPESVNAWQRFLNDN